MTPLGEWKVILISILIASPAFFIDREVGQRWCDTYLFCEDEENHEEINEQN